MQDGPNAKQLIAEKIKQSANILVTVSANPSVDALTAALGLSLMLNKLDKHATAVFSGVVPPAISFLQPNKTFENNVDSLRDFIIALDKDKADRLRYKVEDDVVRIFITPYRTRISQKDLQFSQGDFNVDLIIALGVEDQKDLDQAITAHGRILHDATVATINAASQKSSLGSIDWQDGKASSLSEMVASIADSLKQGILDQQISTALLTGIVASTERFSNQYTTPHVMTVSAGLMAAGANQQLIATKLQSIPAPVSPRREKPKQQNSKPTPADDGSTAGADGEMHINHGEEQEEAPAELPNETPTPEPAPKSAPAPEPEPEPEAELEQALPMSPPQAQNFDDLKQAIKEDTTPTPEPAQREMIAEPPTPGNHNINAEEADEPSAPKSDEESYLTTHPSWQGREIQPPSMGGTLNATAEQALEDKERQQAEERRNHKILTHGAAASDEPAQPARQQQPKSKKQKQQKQQKPAPTPAPAPSPEPQPAPTPPPVEEKAQPAPRPVEAAPIPPPPALEIVSAPTPEPEPVSEPMPEPVSAPEPASAPQPEIPIAPPPLVVSEPLTPPAVPATPTPNTGGMTLPAVPQPAMPQEPGQTSSGAPTLEELERQAAHHAAQAAESTSAPQTLSELEAAARQHTAEASVPPAPAPQPSTPPMPDFSTLPPLPGVPPALEQPPQTPQLPPLPPDAQPPEPIPAKPQAPPDPGQFRIPTQP